MCERAIAVFDSGVGGLSVLKKLTESFPQEKFIYLGDNKNAPYGNKSKRELLSLALNNIDLILSYKVKAIIVACNTLSVNILDEIKQFAGIPVFGVFPPVEKAEISGEKTLLLATELTSSKYKSTGNFKSLGLKDLVEDIESNLYSLNTINISRHLNCVNQKFDNVILGCTHYFFVKNKIIDYLKPLRILDGADNTIEKINQELKITKHSEKILRNEPFFIGNNKKTNKCFWNLVVKNIKNL